jgi:hypothetical protein
MNLPAFVISFLLYTTTPTSFLKSEFEYLDGSALLPKLDQKGTMNASLVLSLRSKSIISASIKALKVFLSRHMFKLKTTHQPVQGLWNFLALALVHAYKPLIVVSHGPFHIPQHLHFFQKGNPRYEMTLLSFRKQNAQDDMSVPSVLNFTSKTSVYLGILPWNSRRSLLCDKPGIKSWAETPHNWLYICAILVSVYLFNLCGRRVSVHS